MDARDAHSRPQPPADRPRRRRADVPRPGARVRRGGSAPPRPPDGRGGPHPARAHRQVLRARHHGDRDPRVHGRRRRDLLHVRPRRRGAGAGGRVAGGAGGRAEHPREQRPPALGLEGCRVPKGTVLGEVGKGYKIAIETLNEGRIGIGAQMVGVAQGSLDHGLHYAQERHQFGRAIAEFQAVQFLLAELATELEASRLLTYNAARLRDTGASFIKEAAMSKLFASRAAEHVTSKVIEIYGGYGFSREYPVEKYFRDQKIGQIYEGTTHMQLMVIAKQLLGKL